jgi:MMPL family
MHESPAGVAQLAEQPSCNGLHEPNLTCEQPRIPGETGTMLGLAVGIDCALFIISRYRHELMRGVEPEEAAGIDGGTAGSAVVFAGLTVLIALAGLSVVGIPFITVMGLAR